MLKRGSVPSRALAPLVIATILAVLAASALAACVTNESSTAYYSSSSYARTADTPTPRVTEKPSLSPTPEPPQANADRPAPVADPLIETTKGYIAVNRSFYLADSIKDRDLGTRLRNTTENVFNEDPRFHVRLTSKETDPIRDELEYQNSGFVKEESIKRIGKHYAADIILLGDVLPAASEGFVRVYLRFVSVESNEIIAGFEIDYPSHDEGSFKRALKTRINPKGMTVVDGADGKVSIRAIDPYIPLPPGQEFSAQAVRLSQTVADPAQRFNVAQLNAWAEGIATANDERRFEEALRLLGLLEAKIKYYDSDEFYERIRPLYSVLKAELPALRKSVEANKVAYDKALAEAEALRIRNERAAAVHATKLKLLERAESMFPAYRDAKEAQDKAKAESLLEDFFRYAKGLEYWDDALYAEDFSGAFYDLYAVKTHVRFKAPPGTLSFIPAGSFTRFGTSKPVWISAFYIGRYEVTQREFKALMGFNPSNYTSDELNPVENVTWYNALAYCNARSMKEGLKPAYSLSKVEKSGNTIKKAEVRVDWGANGYRLPTEAEWEYACRAGTSTAYYWGNEPSGEYANGADYDGNWPKDGYDRTSPVGSFKANGFGLFDMSGNVIEWCWDKYEKYVDDGKADPKGPDVDGSRVVDYDYRVLRGGSWYISASWLRSGDRDYLGPAGRDDYWGFRVARPAR